MIAAVGESRGDGAVKGAGDGDRLDRSGDGVGCIGIRDAEITRGGDGGVGFGDGASNEASCDDGGVIGTGDGDGGCVGCGGDAIRDIALNGDDNRFTISEVVEAVGINGELSAVDA